MCLLLQCCYHHAVDENQEARETEGHIPIESETQKWNAIFSLKPTAHARTSGYGPILFVPLVISIATPPQTLEADTLHV